jgi:hypothetical protein
MGEPPKAELLRALARVVRGLSALFWGIPLVLFVYVETARTDWLDFFGVMSPQFHGALGALPSLVVSLIILYGLMQLRHFQKQERIWQQAINSAEFFALINTGLAPFLFWWHRYPSPPLFGVCVALLALSSLILLVRINHVLHRLTAMVPDDILRSETYMFSSFNTLILNSLICIYALYVLLQAMPALPYWLHLIVVRLETNGMWVATFLVLMPAAMTMFLIWKIKEVIFSSVFDAEH